MPEEDKSISESLGVLDNSSDLALFCYPLFFSYLIPSENITILSTKLHSYVVSAKDMLLLAV